MKLLNFKKKVEKFLLDESGGMSKKSVIALGIISSISAVSSLAGAENAPCDSEGEYHCYRNDGGTLKFLIHTHSTTDSNENRHFDICFDTDRLFDGGFLPEAGDGYSPLNQGVEKLVSVHVCDHISSGVDCHLSDHFNSNNCDQTCNIDIPATFSHNNDLRISEFDSSLTAFHTHDIADIDEQVIDCHISDHWDAAYSDCGGHYSQNEELGAGSESGFISDGGICPPELSISEQGRVEMTKHGGTGY